MNPLFQNLQGKTLLVTGGTGSFGNALVSALSNVDCKVIVFSRDEKKQHEMYVNRKDSNVHYVIGDIRDREKLRTALRNVDYVFHAAALKHVPTGEQFPEEVIATNVMGTKNVLDMAEYNNVEKVVNLSTDKAVEPVNAYGMTKALAEKLVAAREGDTTFVCLRYGNVLGSRGSVVPLFLDQIREEKPLTITHAGMTRFLMPLEHALILANKCLRDGRNGDLFVIRSPASTIDSVVGALEIHFDRPLQRKVIGIRPGEKMHEVLLTAEEVRRSTNIEERGIEFARVEKRHAHINDFYEGAKTGPVHPFTSEVTKQFDAKQTLELLKIAGLIQ